MEIHIDELSNDKSIIQIFLNGRPITWIATYLKTIQQNSSDGQKRSIRLIAYRRLLDIVIGKLTKYDPEAEQNKAVALQKRNAGLKKIKQILSPNDFYSLLDMAEYTEKVVDKMSESKYFNDYNLLANLH